MDTSVDRSVPRDSIYCPKSRLSSAPRHCNLGTSCFAAETEKHQTIGSADPITGLCRKWRLSCPSFPFPGFQSYNLFMSIRLVLSNKFAWAVALDPLVKVFEGKTPNPQAIPRLLYLLHTSRVCKQAPLGLVAGLWLSQGCSSAATTGVSGQPLVASGAPAGTSTLEHQHSRRSFPVQPVLFAGMPCSGSTHRRALNRQDRSLKRPPGEVRRVDLQSGCVSRTFLFPHAWCSQNFLNPDQDQCEPTPHFAGNAPTCLRDFLWWSWKSLHHWRGPAGAAWLLRTD